MSLYSKYILCCSYVVISMKINSSVPKPTVVPCSLHPILNPTKWTAFMLHADPLSSVGFCYTVNYFCWYTPLFMLLCLISKIFADSFPFSPLDVRLQRPTHFFHVRRWLVSWWVVENARKGCTSTPARQSSKVRHHSCTFMARFAIFNDFAPYTWICAAEKIGCFCSFYH